MEHKANKQDARSARTRAALIGAARPLFAERGFAAVGTEEVVRAAGVTRGALYHQFEDKTELFAAVVAAVHAGADAAVPAVPVTDTIKVVDGSGTVVATPDRASLVAVQTPQAFRAATLRRAHESGADGTDDAALVEAAGGLVVTVAGEPWNFKITEPDDLVRSRAWLARRRTAAR